MIPRGISTKSATFSNGQPNWNLSQISAYQMISDLNLTLIFVLLIIIVGLLSLVIRLWFLRRPEKIIYVASVQTGSPRHGVTMYSFAEKDPKNSYMNPSYEHQELIGW
ncbi:unnamed protein product, partial [Mesorhabditis belari]|uniref:Uncharacterized protein n=1 Tax=Mesorhabditis belari TaxID=2138241 RepID=A0AAF3EE97_9BILA